MNEKQIIYSNNKNFFRDFHIKKYAHHGENPIKKWDKFKHEWGKNLDVDHLKFYRMTDNMNIIFLSSTYDTSDKMTILYNNNGWIKIPPVYSLSCNSFILIKDKYINHNF